MTQVQTQFQTDSKDIRQSFNQNGFHMAKGLLHEDTTSQVLTDLHLAFKQKLRQLGLLVADGDDNQSLLNNMRSLLEHDKEIYLNVLRLASRLQSVYALAMHPAILDTLKIVGVNTPSLTAGVAVHIVSNELRIPSGYMGWAPHQDWTAGQGSLRQIVVWAPLVDIHDDFYPLKLIPGSHTRGILKCDRDKVVTRGALIEIESDQYEDGDWLALEMCRGDVAFMSGFTVHSTGAGTRSGVRIACGTRYEDITEHTYVERGYPCAFGGQTATQEELYPGFPTQSDIDKLFA